MRAVIQRVSHASVTIDGTKKSEIGKGFLILLGIENPDRRRHCMARKEDWRTKSL